MVFETFSPRLKQLVKEKGFLEPTLAQSMGIPEITKGNNVLIIAPTGIGKTEAAMLPLLDKIVAAKSEPISLLYITPLRSLNRDLLDRLYWWGDKLDIEIAVRHGDTSAKERAAQRELPPHCLITTPETLQAILPGKIMRAHLKNVKYVIVDEIHELVESKRGVQLSLALERLRYLTGGFQTIALSATVGSPERVAEFAGKNVKIIRAEHEKEYKISVESPKPSASDNAISENLVIGLETTARLHRLYDLIKSHTSVLVFTNTRETAEVLSSRLRSLDKELAQEVHHGSLSKERRVKSEQRFKSQQLRSLVATSSLELGIDIGSIDLVVQYLSPRQVARLIQRTGRAGHRVGAVSKGIILSGDEDLFESTVIANRAMRKQLEGVKIHEEALDVLAMQIVGLAVDEYGIDGKTAYSIISRAYPYRNLGKRDFDELVRFLEQIRLVWVNEQEQASEIGMSEDENSHALGSEAKRAQRIAEAGKQGIGHGYVIKRRRRSWPYYFDNLSTIPDTVQYRVVSVIENEPIGTLDEAFIAEHGAAGNKFVVAGRAWRILSVDGNRVMVEPIEDIESAIPAWEGELIPVPFDVAQEVGLLRGYIAKNLSSRKLAAELQKTYSVDANSASVMIDLVKKQSAAHIVPDNKNFLIESYKDFVIIHACCGSLANATLGRYLSAKLTGLTGVAVNMKTDPYRIILQTVAKRDRIKTLLEEADNLQEFLTPELERSSMFKWRFLHVGRRFGIISRAARFDRINMNKIVAQYAGSPIYREAIRELQHDKMDFAKAEHIAALLRAGKIKLHLADGLSALGELGLVQQFAEVMKPRMPEKEIFLAFKRRLLATPVRLLCTHCGDYNIIKKVRDVPAQPECPKCGSRLIGLARRRQMHAADLVKKRLAKKQLTAEEQKELATIRRTADLTIVYGKKAVIALAGHGVGPETAARLLANMREGEDFYKDILAAEKQFARTKVYWR